MRKDIVVLVVGCLLFSSFSITAFAQDIIWEDIGRANLDLKVVLVDLHNPRIIYIGSDKGIFKTQDAGRSWRNILLVRGQNKVINFLWSDPKNKNSLYAATGGGLFYSANQGRRWKRIFKGKNYLENQCTALAVLPYRIYLGTKGGLFMSRDKGRSWHKESGELGDSYILAIAYHLQEPNYLYIACREGVFKTKNKGQYWEKIFLAHPQEFNNDNSEEEIENEDEDSSISNIRYISLDPNNLNHLYLATSRGVYRSQDRGESWQLLSDYGLLNREVSFLLISDQSNLYVVTESGIFTYREDKWYELSLRLVAQEINFMALDIQGNLYAAGNKGLFKAQINHFTNDAGGDIISMYSKDEPTVNEVQRAAISYAEISPEKIRRWRRQAASKAWLPRVTLSADRNVTDLYSWETGSTSNVDDNFLRKGHDAIEWGIDLTWDLGELIWNKDQTSIDVRSKLMVQLRDNILDEVTKLYFERLRVKMELDNLSIEDRKKRFKKELRLQELTASLDALTGGYFSTP